MSMGRWSDGSSRRASHEQRVEKEGEVRVMSGEVGAVLALYGLRVGVLGLLMMVRLCSCCVMASPLESVDWVESQVGSWALKSPMM